VTLYDALKFIHVVAAVLWVGGTISVQLIGRRALASGSRERIAAVGRDSEAIGLRLYLPASIVLLLAGIGMVLERDLGFGRIWVVIGLVGLGYSVLAGALFNGPEARRVGELIDGGGPVPELQSRISRLLTSSALEATVLVFVIFNMVVKPWD
jgi:uncharacterized membrane protein